MPEVSELTPDLAHAREAIDAFMDAADRSAPSWGTPVARGKWTPAQIVEHVARAFEEAAKDMHGERSRMMQVPAPLQFVTRIMFRRVMRTDSLFRAKTNSAMNPADGPADPAAGRARMEGAWKDFHEARLRVTGPARSRVFGRVRIEDYVRFQAIHALHHMAQLPGRG